MNGPVITPAAAPQGGNRRLLVILALVVGGMIGALVVAMYLPIFSAGDLVG